MKALGAATAAVVALLALAGCRTEKAGYEEVVQVAPPWPGEHGTNTPNGCASGSGFWAVKTQRWTTDKVGKPLKDGPQKTYCVGRAKAVSTNVGQTWNG